MSDRHEAVDPGIFISHRHDDTGSLGITLRHELAEVFGEKSAFLDQHGRKPGESFDDRILTELQRAEVVLVLIGRSWLTIANRDGISRLKDPDDWVLREIKYALEKPGCIVIPVLAQGVDKLTKEFEKALPDKIKELARKTPYLFRENWYQADGELLAKAIHENTRIKRRTTSVTLIWSRNRAEQTIDEWIGRARAVEKEVRDHPYRDSTSVASASRDWHIWHRGVIGQLHQMFSNNVVAKRMHHDERPHANPMLSPRKRSDELAKDWADDLNRLKIIRAKLDIWDE